MGANLQVKVGFGVMIIDNQGQILLGKRHIDPQKADSELHGEGTWTMPGGKLHFGENLKDGAIREIQEETGLIVKSHDLTFISLTEDKTSDAHFITVGFLCNLYSGDPKVMEPDEITEWQWFKLDNLPSPIFPPSLGILNHFYKKEIF